MGVGEREFLISPILGSVTMTALHQTQGSSSPAALARKPFDWMLDDQFTNLQLLAIHYKVNNNRFISSLSSNIFYGRWDYDIVY